MSTTEAPIAKAPAVKKAATKKATKPAEHPKFSAMIKEAVAALKERNGSSCVAIKKYIIANHKVGSNASSVVNRTIKGMVKKGSLVQTKGHGASGSFKMVPKAERAPKKVAVKAAKPKKAAVEKTAKPKVAKTPKSPAKKAVKKPKATIKKAEKTSAVKKTSVKKITKKVVKKPATKKTPAKKAVVKK